MRNISLSQIIIVLLIFIFLFGDFKKLKKKFGSSFIKLLDEYKNFKNRKKGI